MINFKHEAKVVGVGTLAVFSLFLAVFCFGATLATLFSGDFRTFFVLLFAPLFIIAVRTTYMATGAFFKLWRKRP